MKLIRSSEDQKIEVGSTLIVKHGSTELYRIEIDTNPDQLRYATVKVFTVDGFLVNHVHILFDRVSEGCFVSSKKLRLYIGQLRKNAMYLVDDKPVEVKIGNKYKAKIKSDGKYSDVELTVAGVVISRHKGNQRKWNVNVKYSNNANCYVHVKSLEDINNIVKESINLIKPIKIGVGYKYSAIISDNGKLRKVLLTVEKMISNTNRTGSCKWQVKVKFSDNTSYYTAVVSLTDIIDIVSESIELLEPTLPSNLEPSTTKESVADTSEYIIWCPTSNLPPRVILKTAKKAEEVAKNMSERHGGKFYWAKLEGFADQKQTITTTTVTKHL